MRYFRCVGKDKPSIVVTDRKGRRRPRLLPARGSGITVERRGSLSLTLPDGKNTWAEDEKIFRSLLFDKTGVPVSVGLPKFKSPFGDPATAAALDEALAEGDDVVFSRKMDGALIIRAVVRNQVLLRTRNTFDAEHYETPVRQLIADRYPALLDPGFAEGLSLQFEFVSPRTRVVLHYHEDDLILIGATRNSDLQLLDWEELVEVAQAGSLRLVERVEIPAGWRVADIQQFVDADAEHEGLVARFDGGQRLLRFKSRLYLNEFRKRFELHPLRVAKLLEEKRYVAVEALYKRLGLASDDELSGYVAELFQRFEALGAEVDEELSDLARWAEERSELSKGAFAKEAAPRGNPQAPALAHLRAGEGDKAREMLWRHRLKERFADPTSMKASEAATEPASLQL